MRKVVVVGGGVAGVAAARTASSLGSNVALVEESEALAQPKSKLLSLLSGEVSYEQLSQTEPLGTEPGIEVLPKRKVLGVDTAKRTLEIEGSRLAYDALILATGGSAVIEGLEGSPKEGVHTLRTAQDYGKLSGSIGQVSTAVVTGSTPVALAVAECLVLRGIRVSFFSTSLLSGYFSAPIRQLIQDKLSAGGVRVIRERIERVAGLEKVEAAISGGVVYPCEAVVVIPQTLPRLPAIHAAKGSSGGLVVDRSMRTSASGVFAAGDCAELAVGSSSFPLKQQSAAKTMGEVAGANASGGSRVANLSGVIGLGVFGLELCSAGLTLAEAKMAGFDAIESSRISDVEERSRVHGTACSLVYDKTSKEVYGIQLAGSRALHYADFASLVVATNVRLNELAYLESACIRGIPDEDSPIATTAKNALCSA